VLEVCELVSGYGKSEVLRGISLSVKKGQIVTIIGPNGAGKTTLFRTIFGLLQTQKCVGSSGEMCVSGLERPREHGDGGVHRKG